MNIFSYTILSLRGRLTNVIFTIIAISMAVCLTLSVLLISNSIENGIKEQAGTYDVVIGAEGSPMQLVLNSLVYLETPTGNIPYELYENLASDERVLRVVPLALGDSYYGYPIVGTSQDFFLPFREGMEERFQLKTGEWFGKIGEIVLGSEVAQQTGLTVGDTFHGNHGVGESSDEHKDFEYTVVGVLASTGTADDKALFTPIESVWEVHEHKGEAVIWENHSEEDHEGEKQVTALLVKPEQLGFAPALKEEFDNIHEVQAVYPVTIFRQLLETFNTGKSIALILTAVTIGMAVLFTAFAVINSLVQKSKETEVLKALGVTRKKIIVTNVLETIFVSSTGTIIGTFASFFIFYLISIYSIDYIGINLPFKIDLSLLKYSLYLFFLSVIVSFVPTFRLYRKKTTR